MNQSKKITDGALILAIFMVLLVISLIIPFLSSIILFLLPIPFIIYASRYGFKPSLLMFIAACILTAIFATIMLLATIVMGIGGLMIGSGIHKQRSAYETLAGGTLGFIVGLLLLFVITQTLLDINFNFQDIVTDSVEMSAGLFEQFGVEEQAGQIEEIIELQISYMSMLIPVFLVAVALVMAFISQWIGYKFLNRVDKQKLKFPPFRTLRFPSSIIWVYLMALILSFLITDPSNFLYIAVQNMLILTELIVLIQGFSFIFFYTHHKNISKFIAVLITVIALFIPIMLFFITFLGIMDIGFKFRDKLIEKK
ncbi:YybS family protein [Oceanobacillus bengalensis]|uniref:DUF2232 domain-containing protein n=1 Tax=Oceanobacillus bengalensis TaxID=1435466 RepID=A0A494YYY1_9BACI|nr:YybS family protein [Oceanobacillus bengalensis]RKQ15214.1 DUF2232 domain-containing protein [Oceanobacillus bengalensis]